MNWIQPKETYTYDNCRMFHPDGTFMSYVTQKRKDWYIYKGLAEPVGENDFKLNFIPNGKGKSDSCSFYHHPVENRCVVCGKTDFLTQHHVVPRCYRQHFPENYKSRSSFDVLILCVDHHEDYEDKAKPFHDKIFTKYGMSNIKTCEVKKKILNIKRILLTIRNWKHKINQNRMTKYLNTLTDYYGRPIGVHEAEWIPLPTYEEIELESVYQQLVNKIEDIDSFIKDWRHHFVLTMTPRFLPTGWLDNINVVETI